MEEFEIIGEYGGVEIKVYENMNKTDFSAINLTVQGNIFNPNRTQLTKPEVIELVNILNEILK